MIPSTRHVTYLSKKTTKTHGSTRQSLNPHLTTVQLSPEIVPNHLMSEAPTSPGHQFRKWWVTDRSILEVLLFLTSSSQEQITNQDIKSWILPKQNILCVHNYFNDPLKRNSENKKTIDFQVRPSPQRSSFTWDSPTNKESSKRPMVDSTTTWATVSKRFPKHKFTRKINIKILENTYPFLGIPIYIHTVVWNTCFCCSSGNTYLQFSKSQSCQWANKLSWNCLETPIHIEKISPTTLGCC